MILTVVRWPDSLRWYCWSIRMISAPIWCSNRLPRVASEYQLQLDGPLRWHVWPQLSIASGRMTLTARGASELLVRADNMRTDVAMAAIESSTSC